jgi:hypothetical protein
VKRNSAAAKFWSFLVLRASQAEVAKTNNVSWCLNSIFDMFHVLVCC